MSVQIDSEGKRFDHLIASPTFVYSPPVAMQVWTIQHNLGKYPSITTVESTGEKMYGREEYLNQDTVQITFLGACTGYAYLN